MLLLNTSVKIQIRVFINLFTVRISGVIRSVTKYNPELFLDFSSDDVLVWFFESGPPDFETSQTEYVFRESLAWALFGHVDNAVSKTNTRRRTPDCFVR